MKLIHGAVAIDDVVVYVPESHPSHKYWAGWSLDSFVRLVTDLESLKSINGDYLFLISCLTIVGDDIGGNFRHCLVIHESELPKGRGWSPLAWQVLEGKNEITVSAIKCSDPVDSGDIVKRSKIFLDGSELSEEIHLKAFEVKSSLVLSVVLDQTLDRKDAEIIKQSGEPTYYKRRNPDDSEIDPNKSISEQFNLLRICEDRFPAFFNLMGHRYEIKLRKVS